LKDFVQLADKFRKLQEKQQWEKLSGEQREPLRAHMSELHQLLRYLTKLNTQKKLDLQPEKPALAYCTEPFDLALKSLVLDVLPGVGSLQTYRAKYATLSDFFVQGAKPSFSKPPGVSSRSSPLSKPWKGDAASHSHGSTNLPSLNGEDSHDWCEGSPDNLDPHLPQKLLFGAPNSARTQASAKEECFGHDYKEELTAAP
jgi:hypothetical protein